MSKPRKSLKCKFCSFTTPVWYSIKGKARSGWDRLRKHVLDEHEAEFDKIQDQLRGK